MNKNEVRIQQMYQTTRRWEIVSRVVKLGMILITIYLCIGIAFDKLKQFLGADVTGIVELIESLHLGYIFIALAGAIAVGGYYWERKSKKKLVIKIDKQRLEIERGDPERSSSNLNRYNSREEK